MNSNVSHVPLDIYIIDLDTGRDRILMKFKKIQIFEILSVKNIRHNNSNNESIIYYWFSPYYILNTSWYYL